MNSHRTQLSRSANPLRRRSAERAFTLVEVMLALAVSAIVLAAIGGVFFSALRLRDRTSAMIDASVPLQQAFSIIRRDLQGAIPPGSSALPTAGDFKSDPQGGSGTAQGALLQFFTTTGALDEDQPWGDVQEIAYELRDSTDKTRGGKELFRIITRNVLASGAPDENEQLLLGNIRSVDFGYYDGSDWPSSWDTSLGQTNLPQAVKVSVQLISDSSAGSSAGEQPFELVVPISTQSRTNIAATTTSTSGGSQ